LQEKIIVLKVSTNFCMPQSGYLIGTRRRFNKITIKIYTNRSNLNGLLKDACYI